MKISILLSRSFTTLLLFTTLIAHSTASQRRGQSNQHETLQHPEHQARISQQQQYSDDGRRVNEQPATVTTQRNDNIDSDMDVEIISLSGSNLTSPPELPERISSANDTKYDENSITVVFVGRSGSGVSSTIRQLIGEKTSCEQPDGNETFQNILEYTISNIASPKGTPYQIKFVDIPGMVDGRTIQHDAEILASLKSYMATEGFPRLFLAVSRFDDNRMSGEHSLFVQFLRRVELMQQIFYGNRNRTNTAFLLSHYMSATKTKQRDPNGKIRDFEDVINKYTSFAPPIEIIVGDNHARSEHAVDMEQGYYKLPNRQLYPKNVWQGLSRILEAWKDGNGNPSKNSEMEKNILTTIMNNREVPMSCQTRLVSTQWNGYDDDVADLVYLLQRSKPVSIEDTKVNVLINEKFYAYPPATQVNSIVQKTALQTSLQDGNITNITNLPVRKHAKAKFFQKNRISTLGAILLDDTFGLKMPAYTRSLPVGYGYDLMKDEMVLKTPFRLDSVGPSQVGYKLPTFVKCRPLSTLEVVDFSSYSLNPTEYFYERFKHLDVRGAKNISETVFEGTLKEGFNLPPLEGEVMPSLSAVREVRTVKCMLKRDNLVPSGEFIAAVESLEPLVECSRNSVTDWKSFFEAFGTHLVTLAYGGGSVNGRIVGERVRDVLVSESTRRTTMMALLDIEKLPIDGLDNSTYLLGGIYDAKLVSVSKYTMHEKDKYDMLQRWEKSLPWGFVLFNNEMGLESIDYFVRQVNQNKSALVSHALGRLLQGELTFKRRCSEVTSEQVTPEQTSRNSSSPSETRPHVVNFANQTPSPSPTRPEDGSVTQEIQTVVVVTNTRDEVHMIPDQIDQQTIQEHLNRTQVTINKLEETLRRQQLESDADFQRKLKGMQAHREEIALQAQARSDAMLRMFEANQQNQRENYDRKLATIETDYRDKLAISDMQMTQIKHAVAIKEAKYIEHLANFKKETGSRLQKAACSGLNALNFRCWWG